MDGPDRGRSWRQRQSPEWKRVPGDGAGVGWQKRGGNTDTLGSHKSKGGGGTAPCAEVSEHRVGHSKDGERTVPLWPCAVTREDRREARPPAKSSLSGHRHGSPPVAGRRRRECNRQPPPGRRVSATPTLSPGQRFGAGCAGGGVGRGGSCLPTDSHWRRGNIPNRGETGASRPGGRRLGGEGLCSKACEGGKAGAFHVGAKNTSSPGRRGHTITTCSFINCQPGHGHKFVFHRGRGTQAQRSPRCWRPH